MMIKGRKGVSEVLNSVFKVVLVVLLIIVLFTFLFQSGIVNKIKILIPGFGQGEPIGDNDGDDSGVADEVIAENLLRDFLEDMGGGSAGTTNEEIIQLFIDTPMDPELDRHRALVSSLERRIDQFSENNGELVIEIKGEFDNDPVFSYPKYANLRLLTSAYTNFVDSSGNKYFVKIYIA
jgi:hypothetical protein